MQRYNIHKEIKRTFNFHFKNKNPITAKEFHLTKASPFFSMSFFVQKLHFRTSQITKCNALILLLRNTHTHTYAKSLLHKLRIEKL